MKIPNRQGSPNDFQTPSGKGSGSWFATAWFTNGLNIGKQMSFVRLEDNQDKLL